MPEDTRACLDCAADLSDRPRHTRRCAPCALVRRQAYTQARHAGVTTTAPNLCADCGVVIVGRAKWAHRCEPCAALANRAAMNAGYRRRNPKPPQACSDCGLDIFARRKASKRCEPCAAEANRAAKRRYEVKIAAIPRPRGEHLCVDCAADISHRGSAAQRCEACALVRRACGHRPHANAQPRPYDCEHCGTSFLRRRSDTLFCSHACWSSQRCIARRMTRVMVCAWCGGEFSPVRSDTVYCGRKCVSAFHYAVNADSYKQRARAWVKADLGRRRAIASAHKGKRRATQDNGPGVSSRDWRRTLNRFRGHCAYCGKHTNSPHLEHVVPLARGGRHVLGNVVPACPDCNLSKGALLVVEWRRKQARVARAMAAQKT